MGRSGHPLALDAVRLLPPLLALALGGLPHPASLRCAQWILLWGISLVAPLALRLAGGPASLKLPQALACGRPQAGSTPAKSQWAIYGTVRWAARPLRATSLQAALFVTSWLMLAGYLWQGAWLIVASLLWLLSTLAMAGLALRRWRRRGRSDAAEITMELGFLYAPVGAIWSLAYAWNQGLMGFDPLMTLLTGDHFLYVTLGAMPCASVVGRILGQPRMYRGLAALLWISPALVATGITLSQAVGQPTLVESLAVSAQVAATSGISLLWLFRGTRNAAVSLSALCSLLTMALAFNYAWGRWLDLPHLELAWMIPYHGLVNALGFVTLGLLALNGPIK